MPVIEDELFSTSHADPVVRPGWPEILAGMATWAIVGLGGGALFVQSGLDPALISIALSALSGFAGLAGFAVAALIRIRSWSAFGIRPVAGRWLLIGVAAGVFAFFAKGIAVIAYTMLTGQDANWPGVIVHVMFNLPTIPALLLVGAGR